MLSRRRGCCMGRSAAARAATTSILRRGGGKRGAAPSHVVVVADTRRSGRCKKVPPGPRAAVGKAAQLKRPPMTVERTPPKNLCSLNANEREGAPVSSRRPAARRARAHPSRAMARQVLLPPDGEGPGPSTSQRNRGGTCYNVPKKVAAPSRCSTGRRCRAAAKKVAPGPPLPSGRGAAQKTPHDRGANAP
jgi:hypothetical protein